jgi:hypothetical protein
MLGGEGGIVTSDLLSPVSDLVRSLPDWFEYPLLALFVAWAIWRRARRVATMFGLGLVAWIGISSARSYADNGDPYLALLAGVNTLLEQVRQVWN